MNCSSKSISTPQPQQQKKRYKQAKLRRTLATHRVTGKTCQLRRASDLHPRIRICCTCRTRTAFVAQETFKFIRYWWSPTARGRPLSDWRANWWSEKTYKEKRAPFQTLLTGSSRHWEESSRCVSTFHISIQTRRSITCRSHERVVMFSIPHKALPIAHSGSNSEVCIPLSEQEKEGRSFHITIGWSKRLQKRRNHIE